MANTVLGEKREGDARLRSKGGIPMLEETYIFLVEADNKNNSRINILNTSGLPIVGVTVSAFGYSVCRSKNAKRRPTSPTLWDVTCEFSSEVEESQNSQDIATDANAWVPIYETKFERQERLVTKDISGDPVVNSAGDPFPYGISIGRYTGVWEFFQFENAAITDFEMINLVETVNVSPFKGGAAKTWLLTIMASTTGFYYGQKRRLNQYSLKYNKEKWTHKMLDEGERYLSGPTKIAYTMVDANGDDVQFVGPLDGSGGKGGPAVLEFDIYPSISFSFLRI